MEINKMQEKDEKNLFFDSEQLVYDISGILGASHKALASSDDYRDVGDAIEVAIVKFGELVKMIQDYHAAERAEKTA